MITLTHNSRIQDNYTKKGFFFSHTKMNETLHSHPVKLQPTLLHGENFANR